MVVLRSGLIFDGDDTLWETQSLYNLAKRRFRAEMEALGYDPEEVLRTFEEVDIINVRLLGFSKNRFPKSMSDTYEIMCSR